MISWGSGLAGLAKTACMVDHRYRANLSSHRICVVHAPVFAGRPANKGTRSTDIAQHGKNQYAMCHDASLRLRRICSYTYSYELLHTCY